jgi:hypothetical protein
MPSDDGKICELASYIADKPITTTPEICIGCCRATPPRDINEVTRSLAGVEQSTCGVGTTLAKTIKFFLPVGSCESCPNREQVMNAWGPDRCLKELPIIMDWLRESANKQGYPFSELLVKGTLLSIIYGCKVKGNTLYKT